MNGGMSGQSLPESAEEKTRTCTYTQARLQARALDSERADAHSCACTGTVANTHARTLLECAHTHTHILVDTQAHVHAHAHTHTHTHTCRTRLHISPCMRVCEHACIVFFTQWHPRWLERSASLFFGRGRAGHLPGFDMGP